MIYFEHAESLRPDPMNESVSPDSLTQQVSERSAAPSNIDSLCCGGAKAVPSREPHKNLLRGSVNMRMSKGQQSRPTRDETVDSRPRFLGTPSVASRTILWSWWLGGLRQPKPRHRSAGSPRRPQRMQNASEAREPVPERRSANADPHRGVSVSQGPANLEHLGAKRAPTKTLQPLPSELRTPGPPRTWTSCEA